LVSVSCSIYTGMGTIDNVVVLFVELHYF